MHESHCGIPWFRRSRNSEHPQVVPHLIRAYLLWALGSDIFRQKSGKKINSIKDFGPIFDAINFSDFSYLSSRQDWRLFHRSNFCALSSYKQFLTEFLLASKFLKEFFLIEVLARNWKFSWGKSSTKIFEFSTRIFSRFEEGARKLLPRDR